MNQESRKAGRNLRNRDVTDRIISAAIRVHRDLGPGFLENIYEEALAVEFALSGIQFIGQKPIPLVYKDHQIGEHRLDFLVEDKIVVELKAISSREGIHFSIGRSYLKATNLEDGSLLNFATAPLTIKRFCRELPVTMNSKMLLYESSFSFFPAFLIH